MWFCGFFSSSCVFFLFFFWCEHIRSLALLIFRDASQRVSVCTKPFCAPLTPPHLQLGGFSKRMNYRSVKTVAVSRRVLLNLTVLTGSSQAPLSHRRESNRVFTVKPDDVESSKAGAPCQSAYPTPATLGWWLERGNCFCRNRSQNRCFRFFFFFLCVTVFEVTLNSFAAFPSHVTQHCRNQPQEGGIPAPGRAGVVTADCVNSSQGRGICPL